MNGGPQVLFKWFKTLSEATSFSNQQPLESVLEIKHYEDSDYNGPTFRR
jgi:hypothetical protein